MQETKQQFTSGHFITIATTLAILLVFGIVKGDVTLTKLSRLNFLQAQEQPSRVLTYEEVKAQVDAEMNAQVQTDLAAAQAAQEEQLAMVDPGRDIGQVLGASTDAIPAANELLTNENINKISVKTKAAGDPVSVRAYADQINFLENYYQTINILTVISNQEPSLANEAAQQATNMISELSGIEVPLPAANFHRTKILYYSTLASMARNISNPSSTEDAATAGVLFFGVMDRIQQQAAQLNAQYGVSL